MALVDQSTIPFEDRLRAWGESLEPEWKTYVRDRALSGSEYMKVLAEFIIKKDIELGLRKPDSFWLDPEKLDWGEPIVPKSYASKKKGPYWLAKDAKNNVYAELRLQLLKIIEAKDGHHSMVINGYIYWLDPMGRGIARRPSKEE